MASSASASGFRRWPLGLFLALAIVASAEVFLFSKSYLLVNRAGSSVAYKTMHEDDFGEKDVVFFGASQVLLGVNTALIEEALDHACSVGNYSVALTGTNLHFYLSLKKYLKYHGKPKVILISIPTRYFGYTEPDGIFVNHYEGPLNRFKRYFDFDLLWDEPFEWKWEVLRGYYTKLLPSMNHRNYIRDYLTHLFVRPVPEMEDIVETNREIFAIMRKNAGHLAVDRALEEDDETFALFIPKDLLKRPEEGELDKSIERFVELANRMEIPTLFFHTPIHEKLYPLMKGKGWLDYIDARLAQWEGEYEYFTYLKIDKLVYKKQQFCDWGHLNAEGAKLFTQDLVNCISPVLIESGLLPDE